MSRAGVEVTESPPTPLGPTLKSWREEGKRWLYPYRPRFRDWRFWAVQALVVLVAGLHAAIETQEILGRAPGDSHALSFAPISLFFVPVVYASLNFGFAGSVATALWCTILSVPNIIAFHHGADRAAEFIQIGILDSIAVLVGQRVDHETAARRIAETAVAALRASETKYRGLFESSPAVILVLDPSGVILEANPAAGALFGMPPDALRGNVLANLVGAAAAQKLLDPLRRDERQGAYLTFRATGGSEAYLEPALTKTSDDEGQPIIQVLLRDVTEEQHRQAGLKAYAAHMLRAQEEERKRIAQELHDETVQALVLLCRQLDIVEGTADSLPPAVIDELRRARSAAEKIVTGLRDFARALRPPTLEDLGLVTSIRRLLVDLAERTHVKASLKVVEEERRLPPDTELAIFRIAQEALRNVERHARATRTAATIAFGERECRLQVADNGMGFVLPPAPSALAARGQLGILGMQERAELLGGKLEIRSSPGKGTQLVASIPLDPVSHRPAPEAPPGSSDPLSV